MLACTRTLSRTATSLIEGVCFINVCVVRVHVYAYVCKYGPQIYPLPVERTLGGGPGGPRSYRCHGLRRDSACMCGKSAPCAHGSRPRLIPFAVD
jgi:hypothetical protein